MRIGKYTQLLGATVIALVTLFSMLRTLSSVTAVSDVFPSSDGALDVVPADRWRILADMRTGRGDPGVTVFGDKLYVIGGFFSPGTGYPNSLEIYDPVANSWQLQPGIPVTRSDLMVATVGDYIYAIGGYRDKVGTIGLNYRYDGLNTWSSMTSMITPTSGAGVAVITDSIYIIGGYDSVSNKNLSAVQIYNTVSDTWSLGTPMPSSRSELGAAFLDGKIYAIGGVGVGGPASTVEVYDPGTDSWSTGDALPEGRASMAVVAYAGNIYVIGGTDGWQTKHAVNTTFVYHPGQHSWSEARTMPTARWANEGAVIGNKIYVVGGAGSPGAGTANEGLGFKPINTTTSVTADAPDPSLAMLPFTLEFKVNANPGTPTGKVSVRVDGGPAVCNKTLVDGAGSCTIRLETAGNYTLTVRYGGDEFYADSSTDEAHIVLENHPVYIPFMKQ